MDKDQEALKALILQWLEDSKRITLMGRFFDCSKDEGREEFADWLIGILHELYDFDLSLDEQE